MKNKRSLKKNPSKEDWIAMRLLFILMASDVSNIHIRDVIKTIQHFNNKFFDHNMFNDCMQKLAYEHSILETFVNNPDSKLIRDMGRSIRIGEFE